MRVSCRPITLALGGARPGRSSVQLAWSGQHASRRLPLSRLRCRRGPGHVLPDAGISIRTSVWHPSIRSSPRRVLFAGLSGLRSVVPNSASSVGSSSRGAPRDVHSHRRGGVMARRRFQARTASPQTHRCSNAVLGIGDFRDFRCVFYFRTAYRDPDLDGSGGAAGGRKEPD
jgi:hypothetical protein